MGDVEGKGKSESAYVEQMLVRRVTAAPNQSSRMGLSMATDEDSPTGRGELLQAQSYAHNARQLESNHNGPNAAPSGNRQGHHWRLATSGGFLRWVFTSTQLVKAVKI